VEEGCLSFAPLAAEKESPTSSGSYSWMEASWLQPGTTLAQAFRGFLTGRPLHQRTTNFLHGLQLHQDYCGQKDFSTWAGKAMGPHNKARLLGVSGPWLLGHSIRFWVSREDPIGRSWGRTGMVCAFGE
jgi:hypothetical protein